MDKQDATEWLKSFKTQEQFKSLVVNKKFAGTVLSIASGKGGVGKTSIALKLAKCLSQMQKKVLLIDADVNLSNTSIKLGIPIAEKFVNLLKNNAAFEECIYVDGNFHLLSACSGDLDLFNEEYDVNSFMLSLLKHNRNHYDYVIIDSPAGLTKSALQLNAYSDYRIIVVTPDNSSITDSYALIKILSSVYGVKKNYILANKITEKSEYAKIVKALGETSENFLKIRLGFLGHLPRIEHDVENFDRLIREKNNTFHRHMVGLIEKFPVELSAGMVNYLT